MGMDIAAIKARLQQLSNRSKKQNDIWKPSDEHDVRFVPHQYSKSEDPFVELGFHFDIGNEPPILCPKANFGDDCEICDFCDKLRSWKDDDGDDKKEIDRKADWELFKKIQVKSSWFAPQIERGKEDDGAKWARVNQTNYNVLLGICADEENYQTVQDGGDGQNGATDVLFGTKCAFDVHVSFKKKGEKGNSKTFNVTDYKEKKKPTPLHKDKAMVEKILASVKPIHEVYPRRTSDEVSKILRKFVGSGAEEARPEGGKEYRPATNSTETTKVVGGRTVDEAFEDLVNDEA